MNAQPPALERRLGDSLALAAVVLGFAAHVGQHPAWPLVAAAALLALAWRRAALVLRWTCLLALAAASLAAVLERWPVRTAVALRPDPELALSEAEQRYQTLRAQLQQALAHVAREPTLGPALAGEPAALRRLFAALEAATDTLPARPSLAVLRPDFTALAWSGRVAEIERAPALSPGRDGLLVREDALSTSLVAIAWLREAGRLTGAVVAEHALARRDTLRTQPGALRDELVAGLPGVAVDYLDARAGAAPEAHGSRGAQRSLRAPDGRALAVLRAEPVASAPSSDTPALLWPLLLLGSLPFAVALARLAARHALLTPEGLLVSAGLRLLWALGDARWPDDAGAMFSPTGFGVAAAAPLLATPLDLLLTMLLLTHASAVLAAFALRRRPEPRASGPRWLALALLASTLAALVFVGLQVGVAHAGPPLHTFSLSPPEPAGLCLQVAAFLWLASGFCWLLAVFLAAGSLPEGWASRAALFALWSAGTLLASLAWPRRLGLPLLPSVALLLLACALALLRPRWQAWLARQGGLPRAGLLLVAVAVGGLLLQPALAHYAEKSLRQRVAWEYAPLLARQDDWQDYLLERARTQIDAQHLLDPESGAGAAPDVQQLAFGVWAATDLAAFGVSSAVELFDAAGEPLSRFALNLPALSAPPGRARETSAAWTVARGHLSLGSATRAVLSASRELIHSGRVVGSVRVHVAEDYGALPFLPQHDPYAPLYRPSAGARGERELVLIVYGADRGVRFSSTEPALLLPPEVEARLALSREGIWVTLPLEGRAHHVFLVRGPRERLYALAYPRLDAARFAADTLEAASVLLVLAAGPLVALLTLRSLLRARGFSLGSLRDAVARRFGLRLFAAFVALAVVPVAVLQSVVRGFVRERLLKQAEEQALDRASVAQKAVQDYASFQRDQSRDPQAVGDTALQWIASLIRSDLDLFEGGRLRATSKRELYASGLLPTRVDGNLYRQIVLEGRPRVVSPLQVGGLAFRVVSVPVRLGTRELGLLSVPLEERPQRLEQVLADLERGLRVASALLFLAAALLAQSMARRISGPLRQITLATRRLAAGDLETRVRTESRDELLALVESFNQMAADLAQQRRDLERSNRLAAWAEMARQVAHEVKNPLTPIQLSAEHLRRVYGDDRVDFARALETCTDTILRQVRSLRSIVTEFSAYARPPVGGSEALDLNAVIASVVAPYRETLPPGVALELECALDLPRIQGERRLIERALLNLLENALQAIGASGRVRLSSSREGSELELAVEDSGPGVDASVRERLFEPFFSTKLGGSGLGLALVKKIVEDHGGRVSLDSQPGRTRVTLRFPLGPVAVPAQPRASGSP